MRFMTTASAFISKLASIDDEDEDEDDEDDHPAYSPANQFMLDLLVHLVHSILLVVLTSYHHFTPSILRQDQAEAASTMHGAAAKAAAQMATAGFVFMLEWISVLLFLGDGVRSIPSARFVSCRLGQRGMEERERVWLTARL